MKKQHSWLIVLWLLAPLASIAQPYEGMKAKVVFQIRNAGLAVDGSFMGFMGSIIFNPMDLDKARIEGSIQVKTLATGIALRDKHLLESGYFDAEKHPAIYLKVVRIVKAGGAYKATCNLTLKGITRPLEIPLELKEVESKKYLNSTFTLNRLDYQIGTSNFFLADKVKVTISAPLTLNNIP
jgi:polyisoprenoid-binding protein YceI